LAVKSLSGRASTKRGQITAWRTLKKFASGSTRARQVWRVHREEVLMMQQFPNQAPGRRAKVDTA
jgi:hypothetical protein